MQWKLFGYILLCAVVITALSKPVFAQDDFSVLAEKFDQETHLKICGLHDENVIKSGPLYNRFKKIKEKTGFGDNVFLINNKVFNACASTYSIFVFSGILEKGLSDDEIVFILGHEGTHLGEEHIRHQYEKRAENATAVRRAVGSLNKPGYEENVKLGKKIGKVMIDLFALKYSRDDEDRADIGGIKEVIKDGYDPEKALQVFDKMPAGFKGFLTTFSSHPDSQKRKERTRKSIGAYNVELLRTTALANGLKGVRKVVSPSAWNKQAKGDYSGYSYAYLDKDRILVLLVKGSGVLKQDKKKRFVLPVDAKEIFILGVNPKSDFYFDISYIVLDPDVSYSRYAHENLSYEENAAYVVYRIPVEPLLATDRIMISLNLGKNHNVTESGSRTLRLNNARNKQIYASFTK